MASKPSQSLQHNFEIKYSYTYAYMRYVCIQIRPEQTQLAIWGSPQGTDSGLCFIYWIVSWLYRCLLYDFSVDKLYLVLTTILICLIFCNKNTSHNRTKDGSAIKSVCCSCTGLEFDSQILHFSSELLGTPLSGDPVPASDFHSHSHTHMHRNISRHTQK